MNNSFLNELRFKLFKSGNPALQYIGINVLIFVVFSLIGVVCFFMGIPNWVDNLVTEYLAFPSATSLWLPRFYTLITYQFFHADFFHILFNLLWLYWMGNLFLDFLKPRQFHTVYLGGGIVGAIFFALIYQLTPAFQSVANNSTIIGSSAAVMAIFAAIATLTPNYSIRLMFIGEVKIKYLLAVYIILDILGTRSVNAGGSLSHLGGALFGFIYIKLLQNGTDLSTIFKKKPKLKVVKNETMVKQKNVANQKEIDAILDKISSSGYDKLSKEEKETLFKASKS